MADARPTLLHLAQRYTQAQTDAVQPPDDRTYSAEVTSFPSNLLHHRSACFPIFWEIRKLPLHTLEHDTIPFFICQELFCKKSRFFYKIFFHSGNSYFAKNVAANILHRYPFQLWSFQHLFANLRQIIQNDLRHTAIIFFVHIIILSTSCICSILHLLAMRRRCR